jgi:MFS family permease
MHEKKEQADFLKQKFFAPVLWVASFGYFVDAFDMYLFNAVRTKSLTTLGLSGSVLTDAGITIANCQWCGFLIGAYLAGIIGDRLGRKKCLLASIILYSLGSLLTSCVDSIPWYCLARFITGLGLAGELGAGVTLLAENFEGRARGFATTFFIVSGLLGVICATILSGALDWRVAYMAGGCMGLVLLLTRSLVPESLLFLSGKKSDTTKYGGFSAIIKKPGLLKLYLSAIALQIPLAFIPQILWTLSPELAAAKHVEGHIEASTVLSIGFTCAIISDLLAVFICETWKSRKKTVLAFLAVSFPAFLLYLFYPTKTIFEFLICNGLLGISCGIWVVAASWVAESFGTNIRATVSTTIPNFTRATTIVLNLIFASLKAYDPIMIVGLMGCAIFALSLGGWFGLKETWGRNLDFLDLA